MYKINDMLENLPPIVIFLLFSFVAVFIFALIARLIQWLFPTPPQPTQPTQPPPRPFIKPIEKPLHKSVAKSYKFETGMTKQEVLNAISYFIRCNEYYKVKFLTDTEILSHVYLRDEYSQNQKGEKTTTWVFGTKNSGNTFKFTEGGTLKYVVIKNLNEFRFVEK